MKCIVTGRVHPERANISFGVVQGATESGGTLSASCDASQITVSVDLPDLDGWISAHIQAEDFAGIAVGALGFSLGTGYWVELIQVTEEDGTPHVFGVRPTGELPGETLAVQPEEHGFARALRLSGRDVFFRIAVRDYLRAVRETSDCAAYCYRAIEGIKSSFVLKSGNDRWDEMHAALATDKSSITTTVKAFADAVRHGNWVNAKSTNSLQRWQMLKLTKEILEKYLDLNEPAI
jgi:hypothetical protein